MITKNIIKQPKSQMEVQIAVPWADISKDWDENLARLSQETEVPGFRKGQAPANVVEQQLGNKIQEEFLKGVMPKLLIEALQGSEIVPIDYPKYQLASFVKGQQVAFRAMVTQRPEVKVGSYKTIKVQRPAVKQITDADVDKVIEDLFKRWKLRNPGAGSQTGDKSNQTGLVDAKGNPLSNGQVADKPDDNFAKAMGATSLSDLRTKIRTDLESEAKFNNELDFEELILQEVEKMTEVEVPDILVEDELNRMLVNLQRRVADMGMLLDDYLKGQGQTVESLKTSWRAQAEKNVKMELGLAEIGKTENIQVSDEDLQTEIDKIQDAKLKAQFEAEEPRLHLKHSLRQLRTLDLLKKIIQPF